MCWKQNDELDEFPENRKLSFRNNNDLPTSLVQYLCSIS